MHNRKRTVGARAAALALAGILAVGACRFPAVTAATTIADGTQKADDDYLTTNGCDIVDSQGTVVRLAGANWFGFNCTERMLHGLGWGGDIEEIISQCADRGINLLRIPISTELLLEWKAGTVKSDYNWSNTQYYVNNPALVKKNGTPMNNLEVFDKMMELCRQYGVKVMIDVHSAEADNSGHNYPLWYKDKITTAKWIEGWKWIVERYKNDDTLIACDLKNEPHGKRNETMFAKWDDSKDENNWRYAAGQCAQAILSINPKLLIMVEGVEVNPVNGTSYKEDIKVNERAEVTNYQGAWWGGNLRLAGKLPVDCGKEAFNQQIVYSPHDYGPSVYAQEWFNKSFTEESLLKDYWYDAWAYLVEEDIAPLLIGEWGGLMDGGDNEKWLNLLAEYMDKKNISHTFWCINPNSGDTGGLLDYDWKTWDNKKYSILEKALFKDAEGRFVGLDHEKALGSNGINLKTYDAEAPAGSAKPKNNTKKTDSVKKTDSTKSAGGSKNDSQKSTSAKKDTAVSSQGKPAKVKKLKIKKMKNGKYRLTWKKAAGATAYQVYVRKPKAKKYIRLKTTKKTKLTVGRLTVGKTYKFRVRAVKKTGVKTVYGAFSGVRTVKGR